MTSFKGGTFVAWQIACLALVLSASPKAALSWSSCPSLVLGSDFQTNSCENAGLGSGASIWSSSDEGRELKEEANLSGSSNDVKGAAWSSANGSSIGLVSAKSLQICKITEGGTQVQHFDARSF